MSWHRADWINLTCAAILGAAGVGFVIGLHGNARIAPALPSATPATETPAGIPPAPPYSALADRHLSPNRDWQSRLQTLVQARPARTDPVPAQTLADKIASLQLRRERRAYAGAPPMIPHAVGFQRSTADCLSCHGQGLILQGRLAPALSHPPYQNCTQCHVEAEQHLLGSPAMPGNSFIGHHEPLAGTRATPQAPPTMPHHSFLRQDCASCHGVLARPGLRTTHPERGNCTQCHAPSASLEQAQAMPAGPQQ